MTENQLSKEIVKGLFETAIEGDMSAVSCSTAGDYPSIGFSQLEGDRADNLLACIDGGDRFIGRSYSDIEYSDELEDLEELISSDQGIKAQLSIVANDALDYVDAVMSAGVTNPRCIIYAGMWCPTSHWVVKNFIQRHSDCYDFNDLDNMCLAFYTDYARYADCLDYEDGYQNRAHITYDYVSELDLGEYGVEPY